MGDRTGACLRLAYICARTGAGARDLCGALRMGIASRRRVRGSIDRQGGKTSGTARGDAFRKNATERLCAQSSARALQSVASASSRTRLFVEELARDVGQ